MFRLPVLLAVLAVSVFAGAGEISTLPVEVVNGVSCHVYELKPGDTEYSLLKRFGITKDKLYSTNPSAKDGLRAYDKLYFPVETYTSSAEAASVPGCMDGYHLVEKGETLYGIGKRYGVSVDSLFAWNADARQGIRAGQQLRVAAEPAPKTADAGAALTLPSAPVTQYTVVDGDTFYSIARSHGLTVAQLERVNPGMTLLHPGDKLNMPVFEGDANSTGVAVLPGVAVAETTAPEEVEEIVKVMPVTPPTKNSADIAVLLPFDLKGGGQSKNARNYTEYLKGFLIAVDSMRRSGLPVNLMVFDASVSDDSLRGIIGRPDFRRASVIVCGESERQLDILSRYCRQNETYLFNPFAVRDDSYKANPYVIQANIPQHMMYAKAIDGAIASLDGAYPVFLHSTQGSADKEQFVNEFKDRLTAEGITFSEVNFENRLERRRLGDLPTDRKLFFVATSGKQAEVNKVLPTLADVAEDGHDVTVFGYPEWTTFRGETLENMHRLNAMVYSRFFVDEDSREFRNLDERFCYWFGAPMANVMPRQGAFGFDSAVFLLKALAANHGDFSKDIPMFVGEQNAFRFDTPSDGAKGYSNAALFMVEYGRSGTVKRTLLR